MVTTLSYFNAYFINTLIFTLPHSVVWELLYPNLFRSNKFTISKLYFHKIHFIKYSIYKMEILEILLSYGIIPKCIYSIQLLKIV